MGTLINFPGLQSPTSWTLPTVYTPARIERIGRANEVARQLRTLGYRVIAEDPFPDDDGPSIVQIDLAGVGARPLQHLSGGALLDTRTGVVRTTIRGVRVVWLTGEV